MASPGPKVVRRSPTRGWGFVLSAVALLAGALILASVTSAGTTSGVPSHPFVSGQDAILLGDLSAISALAFAFGAMEISARGTRLLLVVGSAVLAAGVIAYVAALTILSVPVADDGGPQFHADIYPQPAYLVEWGLGVLLFIPIAWFAYRKMGPAPTSAKSAAAESPRL
jgi:hypothetical protein